jgi:hypothetical protein
MQTETRASFPRTSLRTLYEASRAMLRRARCSPADREWARSVLEASEFQLWSQLSDYDQAHAIHAARWVERGLANTPEAADPVWIAASLLHDIGKLAANLTLAERVFGTLLGRYSSPALAGQWKSADSSFKQKISTFLLHGEVGARLIRAAGGREIVATWCEFHQNVRFPADFKIPPHITAILVSPEE